MKNAAVRKLASAALAGVVLVMVCFSAVFFNYRAGTVRLATDGEVISAPLSGVPLLLFSSLETIGKIYQKKSK